MSIRKNIKAKLPVSLYSGWRFMKYQFYSHLPERLYPTVLAHTYKRVWHRKLDLGGERYSEKMQYAKLYDHDPVRSELADKYAVRKWVEKRIGKEYLIPLLGCWEQASEIDFDSLPNQFALKTNCGSGDVVIVKDKGALTQKEIKAIRRKMSRALKYNFAFATNCLELQYKNIPPKILAEELITDEKDGDLKDYKFLCFDGTPHYFWIDVERFTHHSKSVYDMDWNRVDWTQGDYLPISYEITKPENFDRMVEIVKTLSAGFPHVRVDLYNVDGRILFGEMTFTSGGGFSYLPPEIDLMLGKLWDMKRR